MHFEQLGLRDQVVIPFGDDLAMLVNDSEAFELFKRASELHVGGEAVVEEVVVQFVHGSERPAFLDCLTSES